MAGSTKRVRKVENINPYTMTVAKGLCTSDPIPVASDAGNNPMIATDAVIKTGLKRSFAPWITDAFNGIPPFLSVLIWETMITPF